MNPRCPIRRSARRRHAEHQRIARRIFVEAGFVASRTRIITGQALDVLPRLADRLKDRDRWLRKTGEAPTRAELGADWIQLRGVFAES